MSFDAAPGRPVEIEAISNRLFVHPASRAIVDLLERTAFTPNQVSLASVFAAAAAALCYLGLPWPTGAFAGFACQIVWHILDGADGDLARRTGRASAFGELVDGLCDHLSQALIYVAFAVILQRAFGVWSWALAVSAAVSHFLQANAYETGRKTYRRWVYGAAWMRQAGAGVGGVGGRLAAFYVAVSTALNPGEAKAEAAMAPLIARGGAAAAQARAGYRALFAPLVKRSAVLGSNTRTLAAFLSMLVGGPLWFFLFELTVLNVALATLVARRAWLNGHLGNALAMDASKNAEQA